MGNGFRAGLVLVPVVLLAAAVAVVAAVPAPVAADGNEAPGAPLAARSITAGGAHSCALLDDGTVKCWGFGGNGRLGQDSIASFGDGAGLMAALPAVNLGAGRTATAVTAGMAHTCALLDDGTVKCWGAGSNGQLGQDSTTSLGDSAGEMAALAAVNLGAGRTATAVSAGEFHTCAVLDDGTVKCWGAGGSGQLGQDSTTALGDSAGEMAALAAVNLGAGRTASAVAAGTSHTCAVLDDGTVKCWGAGGSGQLGQDSTTSLGDSAGEMAALAAVNLGAGRTATAVSPGEFHTCAVLDDGTVRCWGYGGNGRLGQDSNASLGDEAGEMAALAAINLGAGRTAAAVTAGDLHTCGLLDDGTSKCWGYGGNGRLGQDSTADLGDSAGEMAALDPVNLGEGGTATAVTASTSHTCAVLDDGTSKCWGYGGNGRLGQDSTDTLGDGAGEMAALAAINLGKTVGTAPSLSVVKAADETTVEIGDTIHLHVTVTNTGGVALNNVVVVDANAPDCDATIVLLGVGSNSTVDCSYVAEAAVVGTYSNTASVTSAEVTTAVVSNQVDVTVTIPAGAGLVAGTVTETGPGVPVPGALVGVLNPADFSLVAGAQTAPDGSYTATVAAGNYYLYVLDAAHTSGLHGPPTLVNVTDGTTTTVDPVVAAKTGSITGTVTDSGGPLAGIWVVAINPGGAVVTNVITAANGTYTLPGLATGNYRIRFLDPTSGHPALYHDNVDGYGDAALVAVTGGTTTPNINATLTTPG